MSEFGEPWKLEFQFDGDNLIRQKHWKRGRDNEGIVCGTTGDFSGVTQEFIPSTEQMDRIVACVNALAGIPTERILQLEPGAIASALDQADHDGASNLDCSYCSINQCLRLPE